jgi:hypothetical protein
MGAPLELAARQILLGDIAPVDRSDNRNRRQRRRMPLPSVPVEIEFL